MSEELNDGPTMTTLSSVRRWLKSHKAELDHDAEADVALLLQASERCDLAQPSAYANTHRAFLNSMTAVRAHLKPDTSEDPFEALAKRLHTDSVTEPVPE